MKNVFLFHISKALFTLKIFKILYCFDHIGKRLISKFDFKICDVTDWTTSNYNTHISHIYPNISRSKVMRNIFLVKSYTKCGGEARPRPSHKKLKLSISLDQQSEML